MNVETSYQTDLMVEFYSIKKEIKYESFDVEIELEME